MSGRVAIFDQGLFVTGAAARAAAMPFMHAPHPFAAAQASRTSASLTHTVSTRFGHPQLRGIGGLSSYASQALAENFVAVDVRRHAPPSLAESQGRDRVSHVAALRELIKKEHISEARRMLEALPIRATEEPAITRLRRLLSPPDVRRSERRDFDRHREYRWLREHARGYRGQWVALDEDRLIAAAPTLRELRAHLRQLRLDRAPLLHRL